MDLDLDDSTLSFDSRLLFDGVLVVFQASPLVVEAPDESIQGIYPQFPLRKFKEELRYSLASTKLRIRLDFEVGTKKAFVKFLKTSKANLIHISCPTQDESLLLESDSGAEPASSLEVDQITAILKSRQHSFKYVFCSSMPIAQAFISGGVPHVILCTLDHHDTSEFSNFLYTVLAEGKSIQEAVLVAMDLAKHDHSDMVQILPDDGDHGSKPLFVAQSTLPSPMSYPDADDRVPKHGQITMPPEIFVGRQHLMYDIIRAEERFIRVTGACGTGKTALIDAVCYYMMDRRHMFQQEFVWLPSPFGDSDTDNILSTGTHVLQNIMSKKEQPKSGRSLFGKLSKQQSDDSIEVESLKGDADLRMRDKMGSMLANSNTIIVIDFREAKSSEAGDELYLFLLGLFASCKNLKVIVIDESQDHSLEFPSRVLSSRSISQAQFVVRPLGYTSTVTLFGLVCPLVKKQFEKNVGYVDELKELMVPAEGYQGSNNRVKKTLLQLYQLLGAGMPHAIVEKAARIDKAGYRSLIQLAELQNKLSQDTTNEGEALEFNTRFELDIFLRNTSESIEACRRNRNIDGTQGYEMVYNNYEQQRHSKFPSIESMLIKRKSLRQEILLAEVSEETMGIEHMKEEIKNLEKSIALERLMSKGDDSHDESFLVLSYPWGITRKSLDKRIMVLDLEREAREQRSQFYLNRELESKVRELRARSCDLYPADVLQEHISEIGRDPEKKLAALVGQEMEIVELQTVADDLMVPIYVVLYWKGDDDAIALLPEGQFSSRTHLDHCLSRIRIETEKAEDRVDVFRQNKLVEMYNSVIEMRSTFPSLETLLIQRKGLFLEMRLVCSIDEEIMKPHEEQVEELERKILIEREELGESSSFAGVWIDFYNFGFTRVLLEKRIEQLTKEYDFVFAKSRVVDAIDIKSRVEELIDCRTKLPTSQEYNNMIDQHNANLEVLQKREGNMAKYSIVANVVEELEQQKWPEDNPGEKRARSIICKELFIPDLDFMSDFSSLGDSAGFVNSFIGNSSFKVSTVVSSLSKLEELSDRQLDELGIQIEEEKSKLSNGNTSQLCPVSEGQITIATEIVTKSSQEDEVNAGLKTIEETKSPSMMKPEFEKMQESNGGAQAHLNIVIAVDDSRKDPGSGATTSESESDVSDPISPESIPSESEINGGSNSKSE